MLGSVVRYADVARARATAATHHLPFRMWARSNACLEVSRASIMSHAQEGKTVDTVIGIGVMPPRCRFHRERRELAHEIKQLHFRHFVAVNDRPVLEHECVEETLVFFLCTRREEEQVSQGVILVVGWPRHLV